MTRGWGLHASVLCVAAIVAIRGAASVVLAILDGRPLLAAVHLTVAFAVAVPLGRGSWIRLRRAGLLVDRLGPIQPRTP